jgi:hypothetical protein
MLSNAAHSNLLEKFGTTAKGAIEQILRKI